MRTPFKEGGKPLPFQMLRPFKGGASADRGNFILQPSGSAYAVKADGATPNAIPLGPMDRDEVAGTNDGDAKALTWITFLSQFQASTGAGDAHTDADMCSPAWDAGGDTIGKLSNLGGSNRSMLGLVFGLDFEMSNRTPLLWSGPIAWCVARGVHVADNASAGSVAYPADASGSTDIGSTTVATNALMIPRTKTHGVITSIEIIPSAALAATSGNDRTITIWKIDTLGVNAAVSVGTFTTTTALVAQTRALFTLSAVAGALNLLETDMLAYSTVHAGSGAVIPQSAIRANMKVQ